MDTIHAWRLIKKTITDLGLSWIQGPGGNVSIKEQGILFIKPSGHRIDQIDRLDQLAQVDHQQFKDTWTELLLLSGDALEEKYFSSLKFCTRGDAKLRPSMETGFHILLNGKHVIHSHSLRSILLAEAYWERTSELKEKISNGLNIKLEEVQIIDPVMPGAELTKAICNYPNAKVLLLKSHGLILSTNDLDFLNQYLNLEEQLFETVFLSKNIQWPENDLIGEFKPIFPDALILEPRIKKFEIKNQKDLLPGQIRLDDEIKKMDRDAYETWLAIQGLLYAFPQIRNLPSQISMHVAALPTELERKKAMDKKR